MAEPTLDLFAHERGSLLAPAGCGKTQLITDSLANGTAPKPALVLTHTNAGRAALESRLRKAGVGSLLARVATLDSWAIRLVQSFPTRSGLPQDVLQMRGTTAAYGKIREASVGLLSAGYLDDIVGSTYSRVIVDEYQDCGLVQHAMVVRLSRVLPTVVLGDPLQGIFRFAGPTVNWRDHVVPTFQRLPRMNTPWRWINAGSHALGDWLLHVLRPALIKQQPIDLTKLPPQMKWVQLKGSANDRKASALAAAQKRYAEGSTLIIGHGPDKQGQMDAASRCRALMVEALDMKDFIAFAGGYRPGQHQCLEGTINFFGNMMSGLSPKTLVERARGHLCGRTRTEATALESLALAYLRSPSYAAAATMLEGLCKSPDVYVFRPDLARLCIKALRATDEATSFHAAAVRERERYRHAPRVMPRRAVGSTLLLKGLESENTVILEPEKMNTRDLYVAMTRGSKHVVVCSTQPELSPHELD